MRILLLGADGQVGWELRRALAPLGEVIALGRCEASQGLTADLADIEGIGTTVRTTAPQAIVNAAAYTAVDRAEREPETARAVNAQAPAALAHEAGRLGAWLVHYSTDYVFDGSGDRPWREDDPTASLNVYGASKLEGETAIRDSGCRHLILRTSWVYSARRHNFIRTMLRLGREHENLDVVADQFGAPTGADLIADVTAHTMKAACSDPEQGGTYHLAAAGETSWCDYARFVFEHARREGETLRIRPKAVRAVPSEAFPTAAARPRNSRLDTDKLEATFGLRMPPWEQGVARCIAEITGLNQTG